MERDRVKGRQSHAASSILTSPIHRPADSLIIHLHQRLAMVPVSTIMARSSNDASRLRSLQALIAYILLLGFADCAPLASALDYPYPNLTLLASHRPDPRFKLIPHYTNEPLPATAVLMSTIYLLAEAADLDFNGDLVFDQPSIFDDYPSVSISLRNARSSPHPPVSFLIWALYYAGVGMISHNKFAVGYFDLLWKGKIVGWLHYQKAPPNQTSGSLAERDVNFQVSAASNYLANHWTNTTNLAKKNSSETSIISMTSALLAEGTVAEPTIITIRMQYLPDAKTLPVGTVFAMIIGVLKDNAEYRATAHVQSSSTTVRGFDATLSIQRNQGPSMRTPPFFEYAYLNTGIRQIPRLMLSQGKIAEVMFQIEVEDKQYVQTLTKYCFLITVHLEENLISSTSIS